MVIAPLKFDTVRPIFIYHFSQSITLALVRSAVESMTFNTRD
jgi:hypothetical protein